MYPQYPPYPYYSAEMSGAYVPAAAPAYMPQQQVYYSQQYPPQPAVPPPAASAPSVRRLPIKDPSTGQVIPVAAAVNVEQAVAEYHRTSQPSDLVDLDLEDLFQFCKARLPPSMGLNDSADFASTLLLPAASKGHKFSQYYVGRCYDTGKGLSGEQSMCYSWFYRAAQQFVPEAIYKLAQCKEDGWGCPVNMQEALNYYQEAADAKVAAAQLRLGVLYEHGLGVKVDEKVALSHYKQGISLPEARFHVGRCYDYGIGTVPNKVLALKWYKQARDLGFRVAAKRIEELQAVVGRIAEDAASGNNSPVGIPPQRAKPAGVRPDPKARPFTPGTGGHLKPEAQAFQPKQHPTTHQKDPPRSATPEPQPSPQQGDHSRSTGGLPAWSQSSPDKRMSTGHNPASSPAKSPAPRQSGPVEDLDALHTLQMSVAWAELDESTAAEPPNIDSIKAAIRQARPYEELKQQVRVAESFLASLERALEGQHAQERAESAQSDRQQKAPEAGADGVPSPQSSPARKKQSDSRAETAPEAAQHHEVPQQAESSHQAEATQQVHNSESTQVADAAQMLSRERPSGQDTDAVQAAAAIAQQSPAAVTDAEQQEKVARSVGMSQGLKVQEAAEEREATEVHETAEGLGAAPEEEQSGAESMSADAVGPSFVGPEPDSSTSAQSHAPWPGQDSQENRPQPSSQLHPTHTPTDRAGLAYNPPTPIQQQHGFPPQPAGSHDVHLDADSTTAAAAPVMPLSLEDPSPSSSAQQGVGGARGKASLQNADAATSVHSTGMSDSSGSTSTRKPESQQAPSAAQGAPGAAASGQVGSESSQEAGEAAAGTAAPAAGLAAAAAAGPGSMQDFLSFLLPAENPSAAPKPSSRGPSPHPPAAPLSRAASSVSSSVQGLPDGAASSSAAVESRQLQTQPRIQPQPSRRAKPYTTTARAPAAPYRPPSAAPYRPPVAVYDPTQADALLPSQGATVSQASSLQAEHSGVSDVSLGLDREQSAQDMLADIFGGTPPRPARPHGPSPSQGRTVARPSSMQILTDKIARTLTCTSSSSMLT